MQPFTSSVNNHGSESPACRQAARYKKLPNNNRSFFFRVTQAQRNKSPLNLQSIKESLRKGNPRKHPPKPETFQRLQEILSDPPVGGVCSIGREAFLPRGLRRARRPGRCVYVPGNCAIPARSRGQCGFHAGCHILCTAVGSAKRTVAPHCCCSLRAGNGLCLYPLTLKSHKNKKYHYGFNQIQITILKQ